MKERLIQWCFIGFLMVLSSAVSAQNEQDRRILVADLNSKENLPFMRPGAELSWILVENVAEGKLNAYFFEDFDDQPKILNKAQFMQNLEISGYYEDWDVDYNYMEFETITYKGNLYVARISDSNIGNQPDISVDYWNKIEKTYYLPYDLSLLKLDEQLLDEEWHLQYIHLFVSTDNTESGVDKYVGSFISREAIALLNNSGFVWYSHYQDISGNPAPMGHIIGHVYLSNYDYSALESLLQNSYPFNKATLSKIKGSAYPDENLDLLYKYSESTIDSIYISTPDSNEIIDSMDFVLKRENNSEIHRLGDALLLDLMKSDVHAEQLRPHPNFLKEKSKGRMKRKVATTLRERIDFRISSNTNQSSLLSLMVKDIIEATNRGILPIYESQSLVDGDLPPQKVDDPFTVKNVELYVEEPELFDSNYSYRQYQAVSFEGVQYVSQKDNNKGNYPPFNPQDWQQIEPEKASYSPEVIKVLDIDYQLIFKTSGKIKQKKPKTIALIVPGEYTYDGIYANLGSIKYKLLETYAKKNKMPWLKLLHSINTQESIRFQMLDFMPITEYKR